MSDEGHWLGRALCRWVATVRRHARTTVALTLLATAALGFYASRNLSFNVDPNALFSKDLRFQKAIEEFGQYFPVLTNSLLLVVDAPTPELARSAADRLIPALEARTAEFTRAFAPGEDRFFEEHGLLYGSVDELDEFADHMARMQPVLRELADDLSLPTLTRVVRTGLDEGAKEGFDALDVDTWETVLAHLRDAALAAGSGDDRPVSWETLIVSAAGIESQTRTVIVADPILDMDRVLGAERPIEAVREEVARLGLEDEGTIVRITGYPALNHEEMIGLAQDTAIAGALSFLFVVIVLARAFRSARLVSAAAVTLVVGLVWSAAFSAATVHELNPISITFGVLVIGLGIDFMIHLGMHFVAEACRDGERGASDPGAVGRALDGATRTTGAALVLCALTTGVGFLAFAPTDYRGVSDLGLAASGGMIAILFHTLTIFPALIELGMSDGAVARLAERGAAASFRIPSPGRPWAVCATALLLGGVALALLPRVDLDTNVISFRNPATESVETFKDLLASDRTTPWYMDVLTPSLERAQEVAALARELPEVDRAVTLADFVPEEQEEKSEILADVAMFLALPARVERRAVAAEEQRQSIEELRSYLASRPLPDDSPLVPALEELREALEPAAADGARAAALASALLDGLPDQFDRLRASLEVGSVTRSDLPSGLQSRMLATDGHARVQIYPAEDLWDHSSMVDFVEAVRPIESMITGLPVNLVESARATWASLTEALLWSGAAITLLLLALWRRIGDTAITLGPLLLAVLLAEVSTVWLPVTFNFANVIVLPLLLGIGVDSGIHLVHRANELGGEPARLLDSTTARAVTFSAFTTVASFGTLSISAHKGVSSLGVLLVVGMVFTLAANLVLLPALLELRQRRQQRSR